MMKNTSSIPLVLPFEDWPSADRELWSSLFVPPDDWGGNGGNGHSWALGTKNIRQQAYAQWLSFLWREDPSLLSLAPHERVQKDMVRRYFDEGRTRLRPRSIANLLRGLADVMFAIAPEHDWQWLQNSATWFLDQSRAEDLKPIPQLTSTEVFDWALAHLDDLNARYEQSWEAERRLLHAVEHRMTLMVAFLASCPVRQRSLLSMTVNWHVVLDGAEPRVRFRASDMKSKRPAEMPLPARLRDHLLLYLNIHRPALLRGRTENALWVSKRGKALTPDAFSKPFANFVEHHLGSRFRTHTLRYIVATTIAESAPEKSPIVRDILGHATTRTAELHYIRATSRRATREYSALIDAIHAKKSPKKGKNKV